MEQRIRYVQPLDIDGTPRLWRTNLAEVGQRRYPQGELVSSVEAIFSSIKAIDTVSHLRRSDAQVFVNAVDEV